MSHSTWNGSERLVELDLTETKEHFDALKIAITCTPALGLPDYSRPFHLQAGEAVGVAMVDPRAW